MRQVGSMRLEKAPEDDRDYDNIEDDEDDGGGGGDIDVGGGVGDGGWQE